MFIHPIYISLHLLIPNTQSSPHPPPWRPQVCSLCMWVWFCFIRSDQIRSVAQSCPTLRPHESQHARPPPVHHQLPEFTQTHVHRVSDAIQPSHPLSFPSPPAPNPSQHQSLFQWVNSLHEVAKVLEYMYANLNSLAMHNIFLACDESFSYSFYTQTFSDTTDLIFH